MLSHLRYAQSAARLVLRYGRSSLKLVTAGVGGYELGRSKAKSEGVQLADGLAQAVREAVVAAQAPVGDLGGQRWSFHKLAGWIVGACCGLGLATAAVMVTRQIWWQGQSKQLPLEFPYRSGTEAEAAAAGARGGVEASSAGSQQAGLQWPVELPQSPQTPNASRAASLGVSVGSKKRPYPMGALSDMPKPDTSLVLAARSCNDKADNASLLRLASGESSASEVLLSQLQSVDNDWQDCILDPSSIEICRTPDGDLLELGKGAFSTVFQVLMDGVQPHAVKVLDLGDDPKLQDEFIREACLLRQLRHRNIVSFTGVCVDKGCGFIVMELMDGGDLHSCLQLLNKAGERVFSWWNRGRTVALDVARGLHYIHSKGLTHFDIKSANVLLTRDLTAKIADVGFSRVLRQSHHSLSTSRGTFDYMAPELLLGRHCDASVDIYAVGCLLWEICSGQYPTRGRLADLDVPKDCPQGVTDLVEECMAEDPSARPTARALVERLQELQHLHAYST